MTTQEIMEQAQVFASACSLVGSRFDRVDELANAEAMKLELREMVEAQEQKITEQQAEIKRLQLEVVNRNKRALEGDKAVAVNEKLIDQIEQQQAEIERLKVERAYKQTQHVACFDVTIELRHQLFAAQASEEALLKALEFYAEGDHFIQHDPNKWDSVSGEPENFLEDESNTATVEDGSVAKHAISAHKARKEQV